MKKILSLLTLMTFFAMSISAEQPKHEFRATWLTTAWGNDWPKTEATNATTRKQQQDELISIFDQMKAGNMNAVCFQVRSLSDAMHKSSYEPWSKYLTGTRGKDPGYDPLAFAIEEAHKRGLELHAWVNPFRVTSSGTLPSSDLVKQNAGQWIIKYDNGSFTGEIIDPGYPEAREYVSDVLMEIINNYDVDGIVMDDYFYPYGGTTTEDADSKSKHKPTNVVDVNKDGDTDDDWRRSNVDVFLEDLYNQIQATKPWVRLGMGTFGIWTTQSKAAQAYGISLPSGIVGLDDYDVQACNPVEWVKNGYVDYINPQLYWPTTSTGQNYGKLCQWWAKDVCEHFSNQLSDGKKVHFFSSQSISSNPTLTEIQAQIDVNRSNLSSGYTGSVFFDTDAYLTMDEDLMTSRFANHALTPPMDWKSKTALSAPTNLTISGTTLTWEHATASRFTLYVYPKDIALDAAKANPIYLQQVVYGKSFDISGIDTEAYHIAVCAYDRFGVEHATAIYSEQSEQPEPTPSDSTASQITWQLNGGVIENIPAPAPTQEQLWAEFKVDANITSLDSLSTIKKEDRPMNVICDPLSTDKIIAVYALSKWVWLKSYIQDVQHTQVGETIVGIDGTTRTIAELNDDVNASSTTSTQWRYSTAAFFAQMQYDKYPATADFSEAGKPELWGSAYQQVHTIDSLPSHVTSTYILPTPTHPQGYTFLGWSTNAEGTEFITEINETFEGTLYAIWKQPGGVGTFIDNVEIYNENTQMYDLLGRPVGQNYKGIVIQNGKKYLLK